MTSARIKAAILIGHTVVFIIVAVLIAKLGPNKCVRQDCVRKSKFIMNTMNLEADPCNDFFRYACGNYKKVVDFRPIVKRRRTLEYTKESGVKVYPFSSVILRIEDNVLKEFSRLLSGPLKVADDRNLKVVKKVYTPCITPRIARKQGIRPLWTAIQKTGGFPLVEGDRWNEQAFSLASMECKSRKVGFSGQHLFRSYIAPSSRSPDKYFVHIKPPRFEGTPGHEIITQTDIDAKTLDSNYASFIERLLFHLLGKEDYEKEEYKGLREQYQPKLRKIIEFKKVLGKIRDNYLQLQDPIDLYNEMPLDNLISDFPFMDWKYYLENMLVNTNQLPSRVVVIGTSYFKELNTLLAKTSKADLANFLVFQNIFDAIRFLSGIYFAIYNKFIRNIRPGKEETFLSRKEFCENMLKRNLRPALSSLILEKFNITENSQPILEDISNRITALIKKSIENSRWMDDPTKEEAFLKLKFTKFFLSLSDDELEQLRSEEKRAKFYENLCIGTRQSLVLPNYFCLSKFLLMKNWELLSRKASVFDKTVHVFNPEITYNLKLNQFVIPYSVLQYPAFSGAWPGYVNYGGMGSRMGVKLTTGYDMKGSSDNYLGFNKTSWWTPRTRDNYMGQAQCFADEYADFARHKGFTDVTALKKLVPNRLADFQGVHLAYKSYLDYHRARVLKEPTLPGLEEFTPHQLFFISYANSHCYAYGNETSWMKDVGDDAEVHPEFQVVTSLQNEPGFVEAFRCKAGSKMNPAKRCDLMW